MYARYRPCVGEKSAISQFFRCPVPDARKYILRQAIRLAKSSIQYREQLIRIHEAAGSRAATELRLRQLRGAVELRLRDSDDEQSLQIEAGRQARLVLPLVSDGGSELLISVAPRRAGHVEFPDSGIVTSGSRRGSARANSTVSSRA
jgi:hypothetical protein